MAHPFGPGAMPLCGTEPCVHVSANSGNAPCANAGSLPGRLRHPAARPTRRTPGCARPGSRKRVSIPPPCGWAPSACLVPACGPAKRLPAAFFRGRFSFIPSVPSFSSVTVFATVATFSQPARVRLARCSPGPFAALRAAASAPALAVCLNVSPLVAR